VRNGQTITLPLPVGAAAPTPANANTNKSSNTPLSQQLDAIQKVPTH
jgi:hypothetical protein